MNQQEVCAAVERHRAKILEVERYIWSHPETGFREFGTSAYLADLFEAAGYTLTRAGDIPGFYADLDTGRPGPKILILGELDALAAPTHPEAVNGCAHACGHNAQCAGLVGVALALKEPGALDGLSGSIRLMAVPAEELIEVEYRESLRKQGIIHYLGGKAEFLCRGYMDGVDLAYMIHTGTSMPYTFSCGDGQNGFLAKDVVYEGVASHAGDSPDKGVNALYAASLGLQAINALRETFRDNDHIRVHPIVTAGGSSINIIPAKVTLSTYVRGATMESILEADKKVNRALAAGALALGARVRITDRPGYAPVHCSVGLRDASQRCAESLFGRDQVNCREPWGAGSTDMGDLSCLMPAMHPHIAGAAGRSHGDDYRIADAETACVQSAKLQVLLAAELLRNGAAVAREIVRGFTPRYKSKEEYFAAIDRLFSDRTLVDYRPDGTAVVAV
ncbi:MAG: amidohydrolase [Oscillospiraceae bacterium]|nr:amidohydrolase [Oscillospiraceae bacterium]